MPHSDALIISHVSDDFAEDVRRGLTRKGQKQVPSKYLYDALGSALFEAITLLPEYGLTRADIRLLRTHASEVRVMAPASTIVELGSGAGGKAQWILREMATLHALTYCPVDVSESALRLSTLQLTEIPRVRVVPIQSLYKDGLKAALQLRRDGDAAMVLFLGSSLGNFNADECVASLRSVRQELRPGDWLLLSTDLQKEPQLLLDAYKDPIGVTAAFNLNLLARINR